MLCAAVAAIGLVLVLESSLAHSGVAPARLVLGALFIAVGVARAYVELRRGSRS